MDMKTSHPVSAPNLYEIAGGDIRTGRGTEGAPLQQQDRIAHELLTGQEGSPGNYRLGYSESRDAKSGNAWSTPRHRHIFEQVRHPLEGDYSIAGDQVLPAGWVAYFPESAYYGPQKLSPNLKSVVLQYGGPSRLGYMSAGQRKAGLADLLKRGELRDGIYTWTDTDGRTHNQDAHEALWEQVRGVKTSYPKPRYDSLVMMNPASFPWIKDDSLTGVARKILGTFTELDVRIGFVSLDAGASLPFGTQPSAEILFLKHGEIRHGDTKYPPLSAFGSAAEDSPETLVATEDCELFYVKMPTFS
jgi:hypothetical protein